MAVSAVAATFGLCEALARWSGQEAWEPEPIGLRVVPGGRIVQSDPELGYISLPGRFTFIPPHSAPFTATHQADTLRVAREPSPSVPGVAGEIWILGCSFTYGFGLNDAETYPWLVQQRLPQFDVVNFGVVGYSTLQSLIQVERSIASGRRPKVVVIAYAGFHDERNALVRAWRKEIVPYARLERFGLPFARLEGEVLKRKFAAVAYDPWPGQRQSALIHLAEQTYNVREKQQALSHRISEQLVLDLAKTITEYGGKFALVGISREPETGTMVAFARRAGFPAEDISVDSDSTDYGIPGDGHPNALAHRRFANGLVDLLSQGSVPAGRLATGHSPRPVRSRR